MLPYISRCKIHFAADSKGTILLGPAHEYFGDSDRS